MKYSILALSAFISLSAFAECPNLSGLYASGSTSMIITQDGCESITMVQEGYTTQGVFDGRKHKGQKYFWLNDGTLSIQDVYFFGNLADTQEYVQNADGSLSLTVYNGKGQTIHTLNFRKISKP